MKTAGFDLLARFAVALLFISMAVGCGSPAPSVTDAPSAKRPTANQGGKEAAKAPPRQAPAEEDWFASYLAGSKLGHFHYTRRDVDQRGRKLVEQSIEFQLQIVRNGQPSEMRIQYKSFETPDGKLVSFEGERPFGPERDLCRGEVVGKELRLEIANRHRTEHSELAWSDDVGGFFAVEQSLAARPMAPGEQRTLRKLEPIIHQVVSVDLTAAKFETTRLLDGSPELLRIDTVTTMPGGVTQQQTLWTNRDGQIQKMHSAADRMEAFRTTREIALAPAEGPRLDLLLDALAPLKQPLVDAHRQPRLRYRVRLADDDPIKIFPSGATQQVTRVDDHTAEIDVRAVRPGNSFPADEPGPTADDREASQFIQSDDARVQTLAREAAPEETDPWVLALALEKLVHERIDQKDFSQAFATAADVARDLQGDCTEHAVLLAALCRARGIPARVAIGLVYVGGRKPAFGFHMWNEVYIPSDTGKGSGQWIPLDSTLGQGGIGAAHLKLAHTSLKAGSALVSFLPVSRVLGRLEIEVVPEEK